MTTDPRDPRLTHHNDEVPGPQADAYLVLSEDERAKGFVRPLRRSYQHTRGELGTIACMGSTKMGAELAETYAREPDFYDGTYCTKCRMHKPVAEFDWLEEDGTVGPVVGS